MTIQSMDQLVSALTAGQFYRADWNKNYLAVGAAAAGLWYDLNLGAGNPMINSIIGGGVNLTHQAITETTTTTAATTAANGNFATSVFTDTAHSSGRFTIGSVLSGGAIPAGVYITSLGTGTGANAGGTYNLSVATGTISNVTTTGTQYPGGIYHGGDVSASVKQLLNASVFSAAATTAPAVFLLIDVLAVYPITTVTTTGVQTLLSQAAWPRYADCKGVRAYLVPSVVMGAGAPTVQLGYTNTTPTAGRLTPAGVSLPVVTTTSPVGAIPYSGTGVGKYGPFLPLMSGDAGIKSVETINFSISMTTGCMNLVICKPLASIPITTVGVAGERDFLNMLPSLPRIYDGAVLNWLVYAGAAIPVNSAYYGNLDVVWG